MHIKGYISIGHIIMRKSQMALMMSINFKIITKCCQYYRWVQEQYKKVIESDQHIRSKYSYKKMIDPLVICCDSLNPFLTFLFFLMNNRAWKSVGDPIAPCIFITITIAVMNGEERVSSHRPS